jgi:hypothetical protein
MVDLPYLELMGNHAADEEKAKKTRKVMIDYFGDERRILLTIDIDENHHFLIYEFDVDDWIKATREAIKRDELSEEGIAEEYERKEEGRQG